MSPTPRIIELSIYLYRLFLTAYPLSFRLEYGEAMAQLFRDTALDAYRRCGLVGLTALWLRTLADFTISVIRQHQEKTVEARSESALLNDLMRRWGQFGSAALAAITLSMWYIFHLLHLFSRRSIRVWATLALVTFTIWLWSFFDGFGAHSHGAEGLDFRFEEGSLEIWHAYERGAPLPLEQWRKNILRVEHDPRWLDRLAMKPTAWDFSFISGVTGARPISVNAARHTKIVQPYKSWRLRFPFGILPALLLGWTIRVYLRRNAGSVAAMQSA